MNKPQDSDSQIDLIISQIENFTTEINQFRNNISPKWKTSGFLDIVGCNVKKIQVASKSEVVSTIAFLMRMKDSFTATFEFLEVAPVATDQLIGGYSIDDFLSDLKKRYQTLVLKEKEDKLLKMQSVAESFQSNDRKRNKALSEIMSNLENFSIK